MKPNSIVFTCKACNNKFKIPYCRTIGEGKWTGDFCGRRCKKYYSLKKRTKQCKECGGTFITRQASSKSGNTEYCSRTCWNIKAKTLGVELTKHLQNKIIWQKSSTTKKNSKRIGPKHHQFKGGLVVGKNGYLIVSSEIFGKENIGKTYHRWLVERELGFQLPNSIHIHHIDENKLNNNYSNLRLISASEHSTLHHKGKPKKKKEQR